MADRSSSTAVTIAVLARAPVAGIAKTRLIPRLGAAGAAKFHEICIDRMVSLLACMQTVRTSVWCSPDTSFFRQRYRHHAQFEFHTQPEGDLGTRMLRVYQHHCTCGPTILIGTDCLVMTTTVLQSALQSLTDHDAVVVPAEDGGYVLLGLRKPIPELFSLLPWGSQQVMTLTRQRLIRSGSSWQELPALWDIDRPEDLDRLLQAKMDGVTSLVRSLCLTTKV